MLPRKLKQDNEMHLLMEMITHAINQYLKQFPKRCYLKPAKINGHPVGYCGAMTFKIINVEKRRKRK